MRSIPCIYCFIFTAKICTIFLLRTRTAVIIVIYSSIFIPYYGFRIMSLFIFNYTVYNLTASAACSILVIDRNIRLNIIDKYIKFYTCLVYTSGFIESFLYSTLPLLSIFFNFLILNSGLLLSLIHI